jgi:endonuclease I
VVRDHRGSLAGPLPKGAAVNQVAARTTACALAALALAACAAPAPLPAVPAPLPPALASLSAAAAQDRAVPAGYYQGTDGLTGAALLQALKVRVDSQTVLSYNDARDALFTDIADPNGRDTVVSFYTGKVATGVSNWKTAHRRDFATEHIWPQSLGAGWSPARTDLHHLFEVDESANSIRNNHPFGLVKTAQKVLPDQSFPGQASKLGTDAAGTLVFEPVDRHKGDVARALMYFYVRHYMPVPGKAPGPLSLRNFKLERQVLLAWHRKDPVDGAERRRNDRIFTLQDNRNPFVDRPEFAQRAGVFAPAAAS